MIVGWMIAAAPVGARAAEVDGYAAARARALAVSNAFASGQAKAYRLAMTQPIEALPWLERGALADVVRATIDVANERGAQGLEGLIASSLAALASRDYDGWVKADAELWRLADRFWVAKSPIRPNAVVAVARPGSRVVHYLPIGLARTLVSGQITTGLLDIEGAFGASVCDPSSIAQLVKRYGARMGPILDRLCASASGGGVGIGGGGGDHGISLGFGSELSIIDCLTAAQETRAERVGEMMQACAESMLDAGLGDPFASGTLSTPGPLAPIGQDARPEFDPFVSGPQTVQDPAAREAELRAKAEAESMTTFEGADADDWVDVYTDDEGNMTWADAFEDGERTESVELRDDNSYVVRQYDEDGNVVKEQEYGSDGKPVGGSSSATSPGMEYGATPECRALTIALMGERAASAAVDAGGLDPRTAYPTPDADPAEPADLACLGLAAGPTLDAGFGCNKEVALCPAGQIIGSGCACKPAGPMLEPTRQCGMFMRCADGEPARATNGQCSCGDADEALIDAGAGPRPLPVRRPHEGR